MSSPFYLVDLNSYNFFILFFLLKNLVISDVRIRRMVESNISKMIDLQGHKGARHKLCLPFVGNVHELMHELNVESVSEPLLKDCLRKINLWL